MTTNHDERRDERRDERSAERRGGGLDRDVSPRDRTPRDEASFRKEGPLDQVAFQEKLSRLRAEIDGLDGQILALLNERMDRALAIGRVKERFGGQVLDPDRESRLLRRLHERNHGPLSDEGVDRIYEAIMAVSRDLQRSDRGDETEM